MGVVHSASFSFTAAFIGTACLVRTPTEPRHFWKRAAVTAPGHRGQCGKPGSTESEVAVGSAAGRASNTGRSCYRNMIHTCEETDHKPRET